MTEWRPIAEAPRDGTVFLLCYVNSGGKKVVRQGRILSWPAYNDMMTVESPGTRFELTSPKLIAWRPMVDPPA